MIFKPTEKPGVDLVFRAEGELPFAEVTAPKVHKSRHWGVRYRDGSKPDNPFSGSFNSMPANLDDVRHELETVVRVSSDYQLGLTD